MDPLTLLLIGGLFGAGKTGIDMAKRGKQKKVQAETTRYSPWTGKKAPEPQSVDPLGNVLQSMLMAGMIGKGAGLLKGTGPVKSLADKYGWTANLTASAPEAAAQATAVRGMNPFNTFIRR